MGTFSGGVMYDPTTGRPVIKQPIKVLSYPAEAPIVPDDGAIATGIHGSYGTFTVTGADVIALHAGGISQVVVSIEQQLAALDVTALEGRVTALEDGGTGGGVAIFATQAEAAAYEADNPGSIALWVDDGTITATAPTFTDESGTSSDTYTIPAKTGVVYKVAGAVKAAGTYPASGTVTVTAQAEAGYTLSGTALWSHTFSTAAGPVSVTPTGPTWTDNGATGGGTWTTPTQAGVTYSPTSGTATPGQVVSVTATATSGYVLTGTTSWSHTFPSAPAAILEDTFDRADTASGGTLGTATSGQTWVDSGAAWRITGNAAATTGNTQPPAALFHATLGVSYEAEVYFTNVMSNNSNFGRLLARYTDLTSTHYRVDVVSTGKVQVSAWTGTAFASIGGSPWEWVRPVVLAVNERTVVKLTVTPEGSDLRLRLFVDGTEVSDRLDTAIKPTGLGVALHSAGWYFARYDRVKVIG